MADLVLPVRILGVGRDLPKRVVTNAEIAARTGVPEDHIERASGVRERRWVTDETASKMGAAAAREALDRAGVKGEELDLILNASGTPEQPVPDGGPLVQRELGLGASGVPAFTVHATCLSFLAAFDVAATYVASGRYRRILVVSSEVASPGIDFKTPESAQLFGDAAAAVVLGRSDGGGEKASALLASRFETFGDLAHLTEVRGGGSREPPYAEGSNPENFSFRMDGRRTYVAMVERFGPFLERLRPGLTRDLGAIRAVVPHQPSLIGLRALRRWNIPDDKVVTTLATLGNCVAASIPITLYEAVTKGRIDRGDEVLLLGTGAGLSVGGMIVRY